MITDKDVEKLKGIFATKDDLKRFATKNDLKRFATKNDLKRFTTKDDLEIVELNVAKSFLDLEKQIADLDKKFVTKDEFITFEDNILGEIRILFQENLVRSEHRREIDDHEKRITKLEKIAFTH